MFDSTIMRSKVKRLCCMYAQDVGLNKEKV